MTLQDFVRFTTESLNNLSKGLGALLPNIIAAIVIFLIGLIVAAVLVRVWAEVTKVISLEKSLSSIEAYAKLVKTNKSWSISEIVSSLIWWSLVLVFSIAALNSLGLKGIDAAFAQFFNYLPRVVSGSVILIVGSIFSWYAALLINTVGTLAKLATVALVAKLTSTAIMVFSLLTALSAFGLDSEMLKLISQVAIVATGLAFALGGREAAAEQIKKIKDSFK